MPGLDDLLDWIRAATTVELDAIEAAEHSLRFPRQKVLAEIAKRRQLLEN